MQLHILGSRFARPGMTDTKGPFMPAPTHIFDPPFNIVRCSHVVLDVVDLNASCAFYEHGLAIRI